MSKTYTLTGTLNTGRKNPLSNDNWSGFEQATGNDGRIGYDAPYYFATNILFDSTTLATLRTKTVTSMTLTLNITRVTNATFYIGYKLNASSTDWTRSDGDSTAASASSDSVAVSINPNSYGTGTQTITLTGSGVPKYGLVCGPNSGIYASWFISSATLTVVTNEVDSYTVSYNKGSYGTGTNTTDTKTYGVALTLKGAIFTRTGYTQTGWSTTDGGSKTYNLGGSYTTNANITLYPYWTINTYTISYNANGGSGAPSAQTKTYGVALTLSSTVPTRTGYTFLGWSTSSTATTATYSAGGSYTTNAAATLYAVWQIVTYTVSYNKGSNGTGTNSTATKTYNVALTLKGAQFTRTGYTQTGWATSDGGSQAYALSARYTANASVTLYPVWTAGASTVSTTAGTLGTAQTITITRYNSSYTHDLTYKYGSATGTIATGVGTSYSWTPAVSLAAQFTAAKSGSCTITCTTKNDSTTVGTSTTTCTLTIPPSVCCTVASVAVAETVSGIASQFGAFIQGKSKVKLTGTINSGSGSPAYGATVSSYAITTNGQTLTSNGATTGVLNTSGTNSYSFKITDTRGYTNTKTGSYTVLAYSAPSVSATVSRNASDDSKIDVSYSYTISSCNSNNTKALALKYKAVGGSYTTVSLTASAYSGSGTYQITGLDGNTAYEVVVTATDYFGSVSTTSNIQPTGNRVFHISETDKTIARHGSNQSDGWDHQYFNEQFHGVVDITPRRCYATLSSAGWYRVLEGSTTISTTATGALGQYIEFNIQKASSSENHSIELRFTSSSGMVFVNERSRSNAQHIDKIRYAYDTTTYNWYVDIHFTDTSAHNVGVDFAVHTASATVQSSIASANLTSVAAAPSGETIVTEYTFNANGTGDLNVNGTVAGQGFADLLFGAGSVISSNTDCDTLLTEGKYTCPSTAVGGTLTNPPYTSAFGMFVFRVAEGQRLIQIAMPNSTTITMKIRYWNGSTWTAWKTLTPT